MDLSEHLGATVTPEQAIAEGRAEAEAIMTDTLRITRKSSAPVTDPVTGVVTFPSVLVYEGRGYIQAASAQGADVNLQSGPVMVQESRVSVPHDVDLRIGDQVIVVTSPSSALLVGCEFNVSRLLHKTRATAHRAAVEEVTG